MVQAASRKQSKALETYLTHVQTLSNTELMDGLIRLGEDPGPINPSTRSVYERKLAKLLEEEVVDRDISKGVQSSSYCWLHAFYFCTTHTLFSAS